MEVEESRPKRREKSSALQLCIQLQSIPSSFTSARNISSHVAQIRVMPALVGPQLHLPRVRIAVREPQHMELLNCSTCASPFEGEDNRE